MKKRTSVKQCPSCPWRVACVPGRDILRYRRGLHENLRGTIQTGLASLTSVMRVMGCHYSAPGEDFACAGWLANQLGDGNNLAVRIAVSAGRLPMPEIDGPQHACFEDTLLSEDFPDEERN
jgi:uncharacterized protein DUF6283